MTRRPAESAHHPAAARLGIDLGGTKIEGIILDASGRALANHRIPTPHGDYAATVDAVAGMVRRLERDAGTPGPLPVGIGIPGSLAPRTRLVQNANSTWLNGRPFAADLEAALRRQVRLANDANCFALSEAFDGAGRGAASVFGVILGSGCGGGLVLGGWLVDGPNGIGGEWGHNPLPWAGTDEHPGPPCWCGRLGCMEVWVSGPGIAADHQRVAGERLDTQTIARRAAEGDAAARATLERHASRLGRGLAHVVNVVDPEVIVLGGGLSALDHLYGVLPRLMAPLVFADMPHIDIRPPRWGDASGVRGAARLWPVPEDDATSGPG